MHHLDYFYVPATAIHGDELTISEKKIGKILGFDETHEPNHINIVISVKERKSGKELGLHLEDKLQFKMIK